MAEVINPDQARAWLGMEPREDGKGSTYKNPNTSPGAQPPANDNQPKGVAA
jgi:hypothetical protein